MDYQLEGLSTRSFEQLIQALAAKIIGPNVVIFGDGRDGGREATFEGLVPYPPEDAWSGYGVVQAKFKQRRQDTKADGDWALQQLRHELEDFADPEKARRKPDYYIYATNVVLTPFPEAGGKDRVAQLFEEFEDRVPLKGYAVWDYDQIRAFLDGHEDIRRGYAAWITPGDVLSQAIQWLAPKTPDLEQILSRYLQEDLLADQYANLEKRRHASDDPVPIARVFVDMPVFDEPPAEPPEESEEDGRLPPGFIRELLAVASERLDPMSQSARPVETRNVEEVRRRKEPGRFVLIGGPGQGKTTIGQFLCQLFRAAILKEKPAWLFEPEPAQALKAITTQAEGKGTPLPRARRFPIRVELSEFAKELAGGGGRVTSLIEYVVDRIRRKTTREVSVDDFRRWLGAYPWLLVLDGLDEVPASSNRDEVLAAVRSFRIEARECNADLLIVATTRPQGYSKDFDPSFFEHKYMAPLSVARALYYGRRLVEARYPGDQERRQKVISRLEQASRLPATSRLMRSPLQVTIMTTLVDGAGQPPQERYELFRSYYNKIYDREVESGIEVLRTYRTEIDFIHKRVGLLLQVGSEQTGKTEARLSSEDFAAVVEGRLKEKGHEGEECTRLKEEIIRVAAQRLVFLVGLEANQVGFEIRSLQEFMAAEGLMAGGDHDVRDRLREIAPVSHWRNVFLFAAGKCLVEREDLLDTVHKICAVLNDAPDDPVARATLAGSQLALDLLEDIPSRQQPGEARIHARTAMRLLDLPPGDTRIRLANLYHPVLESVYREELSARLGREDFRESLGAWTCLLRLIQNGVPWAIELGDSRWPSDAAANVQLLRLAENFSADDEGEAKWDFADNPWLLSKLVRALPLIPPPELDIVGRYIRFPSILSNAPASDDPFVKALLRLSNLTKVEARIATPQGRQPELSLRLVSISQEHEGLSGHLREMVDRSPYLAALYAVALFIESPSSSTLASALRQIASNWQPDLVGWLGPRTPWPLGQCLGVFWGLITGQEELERLAALAGAGELGDTADWREAERRWQSVGITPDDIEYMTDDRLPYDKFIALKGYPLNYAGGSMAYSAALRPLAAQLLEIYRRLGAAKMRGHIAHWIRTMLVVSEVRDGGIRLTLEELRRLLDDVAKTGWSVALTKISELLPDDLGGDSWREFFDHIGRYTRVHVTDHEHNLLPLLVSEFSRHPDRLGILRLISLIAKDSDPLPIPRDALKPELMPEPIFKEAAVVVRLLQGDAGDDEVKALAASSLALLGRPAFLTSPLRDLLNEPLTTPGFDAFLVELNKVLPPARWEVRQTVTGGLNLSLRRRMSRLRSPEVWDRLALPKNLKPLLPG